MFSVILTLFLNSLFRCFHYPHYAAELPDCPTHTACLFTSSAIISSSISLLGSLVSMRSQDSSKVSSRDSEFTLESTPMVVAFVGDFHEMKTTSNFRRFKSFPMTTWCPYRWSAVWAFGMRRPWSVSSCGNGKLRHGRHKTGEFYLE